MGEESLSLPNDVVGARLLDTHQVLEILKISKSNLYRLIRREKDPLPYIKIGRSTRYPLDKLRSWMGALKK